MRTIEVRSCTYCCLTVTLATKFCPDCGDDLTPEPVERITIREYRERSDWYRSTVPFNPHPGV